MNRPSPQLPPQRHNPPTGATSPPDEGGGLRLDHALVPLRTSLYGHHVRSQPVSCLTGLRGHEEGWQ